MTISKKKRSVKRSGKRKQTRRSVASEELVIMTKARKKTKKKTVKKKAKREQKKKDTRKKVTRKKVVKKTARKPTKKQGKKARSLAAKRGWETRRKYNEIFQEVEFVGPKELEKLVAEAEQAEVDRHAKNVAVVENVQKMIEDAFKAGEAKGNIQGKLEAFNTSRRAYGKLRTHESRQIAKAMLTNKDITDNLIPPIVLKICNKFYIDEYDPEEIASEFDLDVHSIYEVIYGYEENVYG
jgi:hypothetical protein